MQSYEQLGQFYLGRRYDLTARQATQETVLYDAKDLTTHAVCVGMTGSGKTGLCLTLLEEAAIDGIPAIAIDPKGDLGNLLLAFPQLQPQDFRPWLDPADAARQGLTPDELAVQTAKRWKEGLAAWDQPPERISRYRDAVDIAIYTPGSNSGLPLSVLRSFAAPGPEIIQDADAMRERIQAAVSGLLALLNIEADPLSSREHILLATLLDRAWREGRNIDLGGMIREIQTPSVDKVGFLDLESFYPAKDRFALAMRLNNLLASPGFSSWMEGEPLDIGKLLYGPQGKPRLSIISIAHLSDSERMFLVTLLLNEVITWMRRQPGTSSLRAMLYMDEVFGYFPPSANPPSKTPMLTLLKQARAFGLGCVLATQNPVDLDYKGLSNAGTWLLGRLQTERDKARVLEGLEGASTAAGAAFDRQKMEAILAGLGNRVFLMNNVHEDEPVVFQTRWLLSYLRGPMTRHQIQTLMQPRKAAATATTPAAEAPMSASRPPIVAASARPVLPPGVVERFLPRRGGGEVVYRPMLLATAKVHYVQASQQVDAWEDLVATVDVDERLPADVWEEAEIETDAAPELSTTPEDQATFAALPTELTRPKTYADLAASLKERLYRTQRLKLWQCAPLKHTSRVGESEGDFRIRLVQAAHEQRDLQVEKLRTKYAPKLATLQEQVRKAEQKVEKEQQQSSSQTLQTAISFGASVLGAMFGRKLASSANVTRAASTARAASRVARERSDVAHASQTLETLRERHEELSAEFEAEAAKVRDAFDVQSLTLSSQEIKPKKTDISVAGVMLVWRP